ncbi:hypothetical protein FS749_015104 [Ceratobasidium sp. UAMH 11750]|nr:hypothetical protein FS749_015104 [Ceratobasidium sp. UAMH 11750]
MPTDRSQAREYIIVSSQPSIGNPGRPVDLTELTPTPTPVPHPQVAPSVPEATKSKRRGRGGAKGSGASTRGGRTSNAKGKAKAVDDAQSSAEDTENVSAPNKSANKRRRMNAGPDAEQTNKAPPIRPIVRPAPFQARKSTVWTPENSLKLVSYMYSLENYDACKENQTSANRKMSEILFDGKISPDQIANFNKKILTRYKIFDDVEGQTGMGTATDEAIDAYVKLQGLKISARVLRKFGQSEEYCIMNEVLEHDPTILKLVTYDNSYQLSDEEGDTHCVSSDDDDDEDSEQELAVPAAKRQSSSGKTTAPAAGKVPARAASPGPTIDISTDSTAAPRSRTRTRKTQKQSAPGDDVSVAGLAKTMLALESTIAAGQKAQSQAFKTQQTLHSQQIQSLQNEAKLRQEEQKRSLAQLWLDMSKTRSLQRESRFQQYQEERKAQIAAIDAVARWHKEGYRDDGTREMMKRIELVHQAIPYDALGLMCAESLRPSQDLEIPRAIAELFANFDEGAMGDLPEATTASPTPLPPSSPPPHAPSIPQSAPSPSALMSALPESLSAEVRPSDNGQGEAGPGPQTIANMLASAGVHDV